MEVLAPRRSLAPLTRNQAKSTAEVVLIEQQLKGMIVGYPERESPRRRNHEVDLAVSVVHQPGGMPTRVFQGFDDQDLSELPMPLVGIQQPGRVADVQFQVEVGQFIEGVFTPSD